MIIRRYGDIPATYAPDIGEIVMARRGSSDPFTRAAVIKVDRRSKGRLRIKVQWLADNDATNEPIVRDTTNMVWVSAGGRPEMIRQIPKDPPPTP